MSDSTLENIQAPKVEKTTFLNVLFILSAIYISFNLFGAIYNSIASDVAVENIEQTIDNIQYSDKATLSLSKPYEEYLNHYLSNFALNNLLSMIVLLIEALGVILMFKRKRIGYWIYTLSNVLLIIGMGILSVWPNTFSAIFLMLGIVFFGLFQLLYGLNLKHIRG